MEVFGPLISLVAAFVAGVTLCWNIYSWVLDRRDKATKNERDLFYKNAVDREERYERALNSLRFQVHRLFDELTGKAGAVNLNVIADKLTDAVERISVQDQKFSDATAMLKETLTDLRGIVKVHDDELKRLGRVLRR